MSVRLNRKLALCGVAAPVMFTAFVISESLLRPGYNQVSGVISDLGVGSYAIVQDLNFWSTGILLIAFAVGLRFEQRPAVRAARVGPVLVAAAGAGVFLAGVFPEAYGALPAPGSTPALYPTVIHFAVSIVVFVSFIAAMGVMRFAQRADPEWESLAPFSLLMGILSLVFFVVLNNWPPNAAGLAERLFLGTDLLWVGVTAAKLFSVSTESRSPSKPARMPGRSPGEPLS